MSKSRKGKTHTEETKQKQREASLGEKNPRYGVKLSEETKEKIRAKLKGRKLSPATRRKQRLAKLGKKNPMYKEKQDECQPSTNSEKDTAI